MPEKLLEEAFKEAIELLDNSFITDKQIKNKIELICRNQQNRAGVRLLLSCSLAKVNISSIDIRKPYTEIGTNDSFSGRTYDEKYITPFINKHDLPCNPTTAFLTPALRNRNIILTTDVNLVGRPPKLYQYLLEILNDVHEERISAKQLLVETIRLLLVIRNEDRQRINSLLANLKASDKSMQLSSERIVKLLAQHLSTKGSSRLPVLIVAAAYQAASEKLGEKILPLQVHTAADKQTGTIGDLEVTLIDNDSIITSYEMKMKTITKDDIDIALNKISRAKNRIDNYIFITTKELDKEVVCYAESIYDRTNGIEITILDCLGFIRHFFLHLFHRLRTSFLDEYQNLILEDNAVGQHLKETFLTLRQAAERELC